jgi:cyclic pyranopterin phosphate synthase
MLKSARSAVDTVAFTALAAVPALARARPRQVTMAITAYCNLRCQGCRYGRDFMPGAQMDLQTALDVIDDAADAGVETMRLYGGEPLLHPALPEMVRRSVERGLNTYITTNGTLLDQKIDALHAAGLRSITIGYYGQSEAYDRYVQRVNQFRRLEAGIAAVRRRYGAEIDVQLNYLLTRSTCSLAAVDQAIAFARRFDLALRLDLVHYSLPYFTEGPDGALQFRREDESAIRAVVQRFLDLKSEEPRRLREDVAGIISIPDWLMKGAEMHVPCDAGSLVWIGADGSVQLCYVTFPLGNLKQQRLRDMLGTGKHHAAARDALRLNCPNCHCQRNNRVMKHLPSRLKYRARGDTSDAEVIQPSDASSPA